VPKVGPYLQKLRTLINLSKQEFLAHRVPVLMYLVASLLLVGGNVLLLREHALFLSLAVHSPASVVISLGSMLVSVILYVTAYCLWAKVLRIGMFILRLTSLALLILLLSIGLGFGLALLVALFETFMDVVSYDTLLLVAMPFMVLAIILFSAYVNCLIARLVVTDDVGFAVPKRAYAVSLVTVSLVLLLSMPIYAIGQMIGLGQVFTSAYALIGAVISTAMFVTVVAAYRKYQSEMFVPEVLPMNYAPHQKPEGTYDTPFPMDEPVPVTEPASAEYEPSLGLILTAEEVMSAPAPPKRMRMSRPVAWLVALVVILSAAGISFALLQALNNDPWGYSASWVAFESYWDREKPQIETDPVTLDEIAGEYRVLHSFISHGHQDASMVVINSWLASYTFYQDKTFVLRTIDGLSPAEMGTFEVERMTFEDIDEEDKAFMPDLDGRRDSDFYRIIMSPTFLSGQNWTELIMSRKGDDDIVIYNPWLAEKDIVELVR